MKAPSVIIGVGGIGAEICANVAKMSGNAERDNVRFVIIDTDVNSIRELHRKGFRGTEIILTDNMTVERCKESIDGTSSWYPDSDIFDGKPMTEGAGQQRAISRLALDYSIREGKLRPLCNVIQQLNELTVDDSNQRLRIYIISSLAGGTGSGLALPLALYINRFIYEECGDNLSVCKGFFVLSSALRRSVSTRLEQKSLDSNAYAAVKELNAFMQAADNHTEQNRNVALELLDDRMKYQGRSYEYCYLFGITNERGRRLQSFEELKRMVANAVNMQACSPIHDRNSSREDNTLKHIIYKRLEQNTEGLSRFGGIGCGELIYPYEILKKYYALQRALYSMEETWQIYDRNYRDLEKEQQQNRRLGKKNDPIIRGTAYINSVLNAGDTDLLAQEILNLGIKDNKERWNGYLDALEEKIDKRIEEKKNERNEDETSTEQMFASAVEEMVREGRSWKEKMEARNQAVRLFKEVKGEILGLARDFRGYQITSLFELHPLEENQSEFHMEYWLKNGNEFIHPNAIRYFLYQLQKALKARIQVEKKKLEEAGLIREGYFDTKELFKVREKLHVHTKEERDTYRKNYNALYDYVKHEVYLETLQHCQDYVNKLVNNMEGFYDSFKDMRISFVEEKEVQERELDQKSGISRSYVCADKECREKVFEEMKAMPEFYQTNSSLSYRIFELVHEPIQSREQRKKFYQEMENFWIKDMEDKFSEAFDMNILHAMDKENMCKTGRHLNSDEMIDWIEKVKKMLIEPFVQYRKMAGEEQGISICCYNSILDDEHGEYRDTVRWLKEHDGVGDDSYCEPYRIMFYRSFAGLDAGMVLEYLHWDRKGKSKWAGKAFHYYEQTLLDMGKEKDGKSQITPHIDKDWHSLLNIPDVDTHYQRKVEIEIAQILIYGVLGHWIQKRGDNYIIALKGCENQEYKSLFEVQGYLYYNWQVKKQIFGKLQGQIEQDRINRDDKLLTLIRDYPGGIYKILMDYAEELPVGMQDMQLERYLVKAVPVLVRSCMEGDLKDVQDSLVALLKAAWEKQRTRREAAAKKAAQGSKDDDIFLSRTAMMAEMIEAFLQSINGN